MKPIARFEASYGEASLTCYREPNQLYPNPNMLGVFGVQPAKRTN